MTKLTTKRIGDYYVVMVNGNPRRCYTVVKRIDGWNVISEVTGEPPFRAYVFPLCPTTII